MKKKILLIGGCGFIGHNLALRLKKLNFEVFILDSLSVNNLYSIRKEKSLNQILYKAILNSRLGLIKKNNIKLIISDARNYNALSKIINKIKPNKIIHLAAISHANKSNKEPHLTFGHNLSTLENTLDIIKNKKIHLLYFSSSMVYGNFQEDKVAEETKCNPIGIYGNLKLSGEYLIKSYNQVFKIPYTIIRPSALYGERCISRRVGQIFIENSLTTKKILIKGSGEDKLDFTYIEDLVNGVVLCCTNTNAINETFNLTYGESRSIFELSEIVKQQFPDVDVQYEKKDLLTPDRGTLDISKAKKLINYRPHFELKSGFLKYINWYQSFWSKINKKKKR